MLLASILFYAWGEPVFVFVLLIGIFVNYLFGLEIENTQSTRRKKLLIASVIFNVGILFVFKYLTFVLKNLNYIVDINIINIALPVGISFYTFQIMSYVFDVYYSKVKAQHNILNLALYVSMFPQLVAGPIVRYCDIENEIQNREESIEEFCKGAYRFAVGLAKKVLVADYLAGIADRIFWTAESSEVPLLTAWIGALAYTFEIYYDFSGYSDMAIGLGWCFGFHFQENFNYPYISKSVTEFWKRWHISLTNWFRDYVYIPLGGNRVSNSRHIFNLFLVWLLTGIWHGAEWTFILWGLIYFVIQLIEKKIGIACKVPGVIGYIFTMIVVAFCWVIFKSANLECAWTYIKSMVNFGGQIYNSDTILYIKSSAVIMGIAYLGSFPWIKILKEKTAGIKIVERVLLSFESLLVIVCLLLSIFAVINGAYSPFIYFNF